MSKPRLLTFIDYIVVPIIVFLLLFDRYEFATGLLCHLDEGYHLGAINDLLNGKIPYRDTLSAYGPINDWLPAIAMRLFGETLETLRVWFLATSIISVVIACLLAKRLLKTRFFYYLSTLMLMVETFHPFMSSRWGGIRMGSGLLVLLFSVLSCQDKRNEKKWLFLSGITTAFALLNSIDVGVCAAFAMAVSISALKFVDSPGPAQPVLPRLGVYAAGLGSVLLPFVIYFWAVGALGDYLCFTFIEFPSNRMLLVNSNLPPILPTRFTSGMFHDWFFGADLKTFLPFFVYSGLVLFIFTQIVNKKSRIRDLFPLALLAAYGIPIYLTAYRDTCGPQFATTIAPAIITGMIFLESRYIALVDAFTAKPGRPVPAIPAAAFSLALIIVGFYYMYYSTNRTFGSVKKFAKFECYRLVNRDSEGHRYDTKVTYRISALNRLKKFGKPFNINTTLTPFRTGRSGNIMLPAGQAKDIRYVVNYLRSQTRPGEPIFVFPDMAAYYFLADRPNVTYFPLTVSAYISDRCSNMLLDQVREHRPRYIIYDKRVSTSAMSINKRDEELFPDLVEFIFKNYEVESSHGTTLILRRKDIKKGPSYI
ncbi:MAG TPA: hypothetical protein VGK71_00015 [Nitrospirota bacterium]